MTRNNLLLAKSDSPAARPVPAVPRAPEYNELVRRLFRTRSVVAVIGAAAGSRSCEACRGIAAAAAAAGHRVVVANAKSVLAGNPLSAAADCSPGRVPNVWLWPAIAAPIEEDIDSETDSPSQETDWVTPLRREFEAVLLDCPSRESDPGGAEIAAMADAAILVVESGVTSKQQIQEDQRYLELRGVKLTGCILIERR